MAVATRCLITMGCLLVLPRAALALQVHPAPTGLYAHQIAHAFFILSMAIFAFWLHRMGLVKIKGWRFIQMSCFLFILWNINAMAGHGLESRLTEDAFVGADFTKALVVDRAFAPYLYYFLKMDHFLCVPAMILLLMGLKRLKAASEGGGA